MEIPVFDEDNETLNHFLKRLDQYKLFLLQSKYDMILEFMNTLLDTKHTSLLSIVNIKEEQLLSTNYKNKKILKTLMPKITDICKISTKIDETTDTDEIKEDDTIVYLRRMLQTIEYSLFKKSTQKGVIYSIKK